MLHEAWSAVHSLRFQHRSNLSHDGEGVGGPDSFSNGVNPAANALLALGSSGRAVLNGRRREQSLLVPMVPVLSCVPRPSLAAACSSGQSRARVTADPRAAILAACDEKERLTRRNLNLGEVGTATVLREVAAVRAVVAEHLPFTPHGLLTVCTTCGGTEGRFPCVTLLAPADGFAPGWREAT